MVRGSRPGLIVLLVAGFVTACASIMGIEDAVVDPAFEAGSGGDGAVVAPSAVDGAVSDDGGCVGQGCPCATDTDCRDRVKYAVCVEGKCGICTSQPTDTCRPGSYCAPPSADGGVIVVPDGGQIPNSTTSECLPGCKDDADCVALTATVAPFCLLATRTCAGCRTSADCPGQVCSPSGKCTNRCDTATPCTGANELCCETAAGKLCIGVKDDPLNCDQCGRICPGGANALCCNGVCEDRTTSVNACGSCGFACNPRDGVPRCANGTCDWTCNPGFAHCETDNTGCETNITNNTTRCGACTTDCNVTTQNASTPSCVDRTCSYATCSTGFSDCDSNKANGCERQAANCCPATGCGGCPNGVCEITWGGSENVTCPPNVPCKVTCKSQNQCNGGTITCAANQPCTVICNGPDACNSETIIVNSGKLCLDCNGNPGCNSMSVELQGSATIEIACTDGNDCKFSACSGCPSPKPVVSSCP